MGGVVTDKAAGGDVAVGRINGSIIIGTRRAVTLVTAYGRLTDRCREKPAWHAAGQ